MQRNFEINLMKSVTESDKLKRGLVKIGIQELYQTLALSAITEDSMNSAIQNFKNNFSDEKVCVDISMRKKAKDYIDL